MNPTDKESLAIILAHDYELFSIAKNFDRYLIKPDISDAEIAELKTRYELSVLVDKNNLRDFGDTIVIKASGVPHPEVELDSNRLI